MTTQPAPPPKRVPTEPLERLAAAYGVATSYDDWAGRPVPVAPETVRAVLALIGVDAADPVTALRAHDQQRHVRGLPPTIVIDDARRPDPVPATLVAGATRVATIDLEDGMKSLIAWRDRDSAAVAARRKRAEK